MPRVGRQARNKPHDLRDLSWRRAGAEPALDGDARYVHDDHALPDLQASIADWESHKDFVSRDLFDSILKSEEEHVDWLETQLGLIDSMGVENYLQSAT